MLLSCNALIETDGEAGLEFSDKTTPEDIENTKEKEVDPLFLDGPSLYKVNCASCHNTLENSSKKESTAFAIESAIASQPQMYTEQLLKLENEQIFQVAKALSLSPPKLFSVVPVGDQPYAASINLNFRTDENAICRYDLSDKPFSSMSQSFDQTVLSVRHFKDISVDSGESYKFYVRCQDQYGHESKVGTLVNFSMGEKLPEELTPAVISDVKPNDNFESGTKQVTLSLSTDKDSVCRFSIDESEAFSQMDLMGTTGFMNHRHTVTGLNDDNRYEYYFMCEDRRGNKSIKAYTSFKVLLPRLLDGKELYKVNCSSCHNELSNSNKKYISSKEIEDAISTIGSMKTEKLRELNSAQRDAIAAVLSDFEEVTISKDRLETYVQLVDRRFVYKIVGEAFGAGDIETRSRHREDWLTYFNFDAFGGACDLYSSAGDQFEYDRCPRNGSHVYANKGSLYTNMRAAYSIRVCEAYAGSNSAGQRFKYIMDPLGGLNSDWSTEKFHIIYEKFYRLETPAPEVTTKFKELFDAQVDKETGWKGIILGVCTSPGWQIL